MENIFDQIDDEVSAPAASTLVRGQENLFDEFDNDPPPADLGPNSSTHLKSTPGPLPAWQQQMIDGVSISNAREAAKVLTKAERDNPRMETPEESASFFGAFQNGLGPQNYAAFADMLDHLGDMRGDKGMHDWADGIRKSLEEDKSSYKAIYQSYKQIRGLSSAWDYAKESAGQMLGVMTPSLAGGFMGGLGGGALGSRFGGKTGAAVGGAMGGIAGAASGSIHLHISEMRGALKREGMEGENLVDYTNYGAAVLASLDALFPGLAMARFGGFARKKLAEGVASKLAENLAKGGKLATIAEFNKQFGKQLAKDTLLEVTTELAQQAVTDLGAKRLAGKEITKGDLEKFAYETAPEIALRTAIGTAFVGAGPSAIQAGKTLSDTRAKAQAEQQSPGDRKADRLVTDQGDVVDPAEAPPPAPVDGTPAVDELAAQQPAVEDASREAPAPVDQRQKGDSVLRFIRDSGGLQPSGELDALDAQRYPGLINENGLTADQMREALIENGYLEETGPDAPSVTTPQDVYDLVQRAISGERIVPLADQKADDAHFSGPDDGDARRALLQNEKQFVLPQIEQYDEEFGEPVLAKVYRGLKEDDRLEVIDRARRGEDVADLLEEVSMREADVEALQEMTAKRGPDPQVVERIREMIAQQQPDLLTGFDEVVAAMPARRPRAARGSLNLREGEHPGDRSMAELMQMSKAELSSAAARSGVPARPNWSKERIAGELRAAAARRLTPEPTRELKMGEMPDKPAVPVKFSVTPAAIVSLIDSSKHTDIRPHLKQRGVTLEQYARQFDLPPDYPVLAPNEVDRRYDAVRTTVSDDEFAKRFTIGAELAPSESASEAKATPQPEKPQRDTGAEFLRLLAGKTPRAQWASSLGVTEKELKPHIDRALAKGLLRRDRNGVIRRNPAALKEFEPETEIVNQKVERAVEQGAAAMVAPGRIEGADVAMTPAAIDKAAEIKGVVTRALAGILPRDVRIDVVDTIEIGRLAREDELLSLRDMKEAQRELVLKYHKEMLELGDRRLEVSRKIRELRNRRNQILDSDAAAQEAGVVSFQAKSGRGLVDAIEAEIDTLKAERNRLAVLQQAAVENENRARGYRFDDAPRGDVTSFPRKDQRYSLRSSKSATVDEGTEGESDGVQKDSGDSGKARDDKSEPADAGAIAAAVGGGDAPGSSAAEGRILRQESATLRDDGSIRAGRISGKARGAVSRGRNAETLQPVGAAEFFDAPGFRGVVTAGAPADHALLDRRGAPPSEYRLATLTYRLYDENAPMTEAQLKNFQPNFRAGGEFYAPLIWARVSQHMDGTWEVSMIQRIAAAGDAPRGMSSKLYAAIEADLGIRMSPSGILSKEGLAMWQKRSPESVKWHQWSKHEQYFISPRRIKDNIDRIGKELAAIAARPDSDETKAIDLKSARKERGELIKLWGQLPLEARAATPNMFSLRQSPDRPRTPASSQLEALGQTDLYSQTISIAVRAIEAEARRTGKSMAKVAIQAGRHEALEFFQGIGLIRPQEWANLRAAAIAENWIDETGVREAYTAKYGSILPPAELEELILKEAIMEKYGAYERGEFAPKGIVRKVMDRVKNFLQSVMNGLRGLGFERWEDIFQKVDAGELRKRYEAIYGDTRGISRAVAEQGARGDATANPDIKGIEAPQPMIRAGQIPDARGQAPTPGQAGEVKGIAELIDEFKRAIGLTARTGRLDPSLKRAASQAGGELLGQYNGVARTKIQGDIDILTHEGGHHLERTLGADLAAIMQANQAELTPLATSLGNPLSEGFAEFFRRYVTNPTAAAARAPGFFRDFEDLLDANNPEMLEQLQSIQREYDRFLLGDPVEQGIANQTVVKRTQNAFSKALSDIERDGFVSTIGDRLHTLYYNLISQNHGWWIAVRDLLGDIEARTGQRISLAAKDNPNKLIRMISHTAAWAQQDLKDGIALRGRPNGGGVSMHQVLATAFGGTDKSQWNERATQEFGEYLIARRAIHQYVRFRPAFRQQIQQFVAANPSLAFILQRLPNNLTPELERPPTKESLTHQLMKLKALEERQPQFRQAAELYYAFNRDIIRFLHEKQLITKEERDEYLRDRDYAPFQRDMSDKEPARGKKSASRRPGRAADTANKNDVYRRFEGSMRDIINPIQSTSQLVYEMRLRAAINDTLLAMDRLADQAGPAGKEIFERVPAHEAKAMHVNMREALRQSAKAAGMSPTDTAVMLTNVEGQIGQNVVTTMFTQQKAGERGERIVWFYKDGEAVPAQIADGELGRMMFEGLTANGYRNMDLLTKILSFPANIVRFGVTASFEFIFRNIFVDSIVAPINSPYSRSILTAAAGARDIARGGRSHQLYNRYAGMLGGEFSTSISDQSIQRDVEALRRKGFKVRMPKNALDLFRLVFTGLGEASESSTRVGIFRNAMQSAIADGMSEHDAAIEAAHYAHDVMDFSRHGSKTETLRRTIPFWNAAIQGMDKYFRTLAGANDYGTLIGIWQRHRAGQPLSVNEQKAVGQAARAWAISVPVLGGVSLLFSYLGEDDEDQDEITDQLRATHWRVSLDGILYLLPKSVKTFMNWDDDSDVTVRLPKPFEIATFANGFERAYDAARKGDKTAFQGWLKDFWAGVAPPDSMPGLDLTYGFLTGKDLYSGRDIIPTWEKDLERPEQFGPYTTETARRIGKSVNMSPYYVDYLVRGIGASLGRDVTTLIDIAAQKGPMPSIEEYPIARRFTYNTGRNSKSIGKFYDMTSDKEGLNAWFWDAVSSDARSFNAAANTYKRLQDAKKDSEAADYLNRINPDQRVFAILSADFEKGKAKLRNLHPIINAQEAITVTNNLMKEVVDGTLLVGKKGEERKPIDREQARFARNEIGHIRKGIAQNALRSLEIEGWAQQKLMDVDARIATLKAGAPEVYGELMRRLKAKDVQKFSHIAQVWPEVKRRVLQDKGEAQISDLAYGKVEGY